MSNEANKDMDSIFEYISLDSIKYANETLENIYSLIYELEDSPYLGRYVPELLDKQFREIIYKNYRIVYDISKDSNIVYIHFVVHSKRNFKSFYKSYIKNNF
jgi:plasmid stabilization system protein ParE